MGFSTEKTKEFRMFLKIRILFSLLQFFFVNQKLKMFKNLRSTYFSIWLTLKAEKRDVRKIFKILSIAMPVHFDLEIRQLKQFLFFEFILFDLLGSLVFQKDLERFLIQL